jgi:hypothetical protein
MVSGISIPYAVYTYLTLTKCGWQAAGVKAQGGKLVCC